MAGQTVDRLTAIQMLLKYERSRNPTALKAPEISDFDELTNGELLEKIHESRSIVGQNITAVTD